MQIKSNLKYSVADYNEYTTKCILDAFRNLIRRGIRMWEEATCLRFRENAQARDAIRYFCARLYASPLSTLFKLFLVNNSFQQTNILY